jgi:hypothetical protein
LELEDDGAGDVLTTCGTTHSPTSDEAMGDEYDRARWLAGKDLDCVVVTLSESSRNLGSWWCIYG